MASSPAPSGRKRISRYERGQWELRESLCSRIIELEAILKSKSARDPLSAADEVLADEAFASLSEAKSALRHDHRRRLPSAHMAVAQAHYDLAYILMLRLSSLDEVGAMLPGLVAYIKEHLPVADERRTHVEEIALSVRSGSVLDEAQREVLVNASDVARQMNLRETLRVRSFAFIVFGVSAVLAVIAGLVALAGVLSPGKVPLCFNPESVGVVCPTASAAVDPDDAVPGEIDGRYAMVASAWDYPVVEFVGLVAASVAAAASLRRIRGTSTPYNVPVALALLKLPTGALTAPLGLLLMRGDFIPGLSALDSSAQVIAWAVIFGYAQQLFTRFVDNQAQAVLSSVGGPNNVRVKPAREGPQPPA